MQNASHTIKEEIIGVAVFVGVIWAVFLATCVLPAIDRFGLVPRTSVGLFGIVTMPLLHANLNHILSNTLPLFILLILLAGSKARSWMIVFAVALLGGGLLWLFGRHANHIGASGLIFGLIGFLIVSGLLEWRIVPLIISVMVGFFYGGTLISGVLPQMDTQVSWDGHLCGAVAGIVVAYFLARPRRTDFQGKASSDVSY